MTTLIIGGSGLLGTELIRQAKAAGHATAAMFATREPCSASQADRVIPWILRAEHAQGLGQSGLSEVPVRLPGCP